MKEMASVYVLAKAGRPIYVGATFNLRRRLYEHARKQYDAVWHQDVISEQRFALEVRLIKALRPLFNTTHNPNRYSSEPTVAYLISIPREDLMLVQAVAKATGRSTACIIREAIREWIERRLT